MMDWTDRHDRYFLRLIAPDILLYTEMIPAGAILHGDAARFLDHDAAEHPLALQIGGSDPGELAACARRIDEYGYDEINLNVGCPSDRVGQGGFGACLMATPARVADCVAAMGEATATPVTVKTRIGIDDLDSYEYLAQFIATVAERGGCQSFIIHARKAWLSGLSPKQNREVPPLEYDRVYRLKRDFPDLEIILNGGVTDADSIADHLEHTDGVMIGREAYQNPWFLRTVARRYLGAGEPLRRADIIAALLPYAEAHCARGGAIKHITRHILGLYKGVPGAARWRRHLSENAHRPGAGPEIIAAACALMPPDA